MPKVETVLAINVNREGMTRRFCEVRVKGQDIYVYQPRKQALCKVSYHKSGIKHMKTDTGPPLFSQRLRPPASVSRGIAIWHKSCENFNEMLPADSQHRDYSLELRVPCSTTILYYVEVSVGKYFGSSEWVEQDVTNSTVEQRLFQMGSMTICVRLMGLMDVRETAHEHNTQP